MKLMFENVKEWAEGVWKIDVSRETLSRFGAGEARGRYSVLAVPAAEFDRGAHRLMVKLDDIEILSLGTLDEAVMFSGQKPPAQVMTQSESDSAFIAALGELPSEVANAGRSLLQKVRAVSPGWMKKGQRRNFSNAPDNFWYVIVQPQRRNLSITVRGTPDRFEGYGLPVKADRPGYTRFFLSGAKDVEPAFEIIQQSKQKG